MEVVLGLKYTALHSILKIRFGHTPVVEVKMPHPPAKAEQPVPTASVRRSSQCGLIKLFIVAVGRQALVNPLLALVNCRLPFELTLAVVNEVP